MYRHRQKPEDFTYLTPPSIFVTNLSPGPLDAKKLKTPKSKILATPSSARKRSKSNESKARTPKVKGEEGEKRGRKKKEILSEEPIPELDETSEDTPATKRTRKKKVKVEADEEVSKTPKSKKAQAKISDFFQKKPKEPKVEPLKVKIKQEPVDPGEGPSGSQDGAPEEAPEPPRVYREEETDPDVPHIPGVVWRVGAKCEVMDNDGSWYRGKMVQVSKEYKMAKVHFEGWKPKWDAWYMMDTDMIRAAGDWADLDAAAVRALGKKKIVPPKPAKAAKTPKKKKIKSEPVSEPEPEPEAADEEEPEVDVEEPEADDHDTSQESLAEAAAAEELVFIDELKFEVGAKVEAQDKTNHWYRGRIVAVSHEQQVVKVHYDGWKHRWDTWYTMDTERLRPFTRDWIDPRLLPKIKKKRKKKSTEPTPAEAEVPAESTSGKDEIKSPDQPAKKKGKKKSLDSEVREEASTEVESEEKTKRKRKKKGDDDMIEYLPERTQSTCVVLEEVDEEEETTVNPPDEISYSNLLEEKDEEEEASSSRKRSKRKKRARSDASEWASEEMLDHVTADNQEEEDEEVVQVKPAKRRRKESSDALEEEAEPKKKRRGRQKKNLVFEKDEDAEELQIKTEETVTEQLKEEPDEILEEEEEEIPKPRSPKKVKKQKSSEKKGRRRSSARESMSETDPDPFDEPPEPPEESPPSDLEDQDDYTPSGFKKSKKGTKGRTKKFVPEGQSLSKGAEWRKVGDDEFMDIPPPSGDTFIMPLPKKEKKKKEKKMKIKKEKKIPKPLPEYTDAYKKAMLAMTMNEAKEKRRLERKIERLKQKESEEKSKKKSRRGGPSAYQLFCNSNRPRLMAQNPGASFALINKKLGETWHNIGEREKATWRRKSKKMKDKGQVVPKATAYSKKVKELTSLLKPGQKSAQGMMDSQLFSSPTQPFKVVGTEPLEAAAHLKLLGESLSIIGQRLQDHQGQFAVQGTVSVMLDSFLCSLGPLMCLTTQVPELDSLPQKTLTDTLDSIAYFMPGL